MEITGKTVLITGAAKRVGRALAQAFAAVGANLLLHYRDSAAEAEELRQLLPRPERHRLLPADLADPNAAAGLFSHAGHVDILVNNAAMFNTVPLKDEIPEGMQTQLQVNFLAPLELMRQFARQPGLQSGCIVNIVDQQIVRHPDDSGSYLLSKKGLAEASLLAARQFAPTIRVNAIAPGPVLPPSWLPPGTGMRKVLAGIPLGRPVDMADLTSACLFLCANESITGQVLFVDCGQHLS